MMKKPALMLALMASAAPIAPALAQTEPPAFTSAVRYDAARRVTGTISADPDHGRGTSGASGPLPFRAVRNSYDGAGRLVTIETGTLSSWQAADVAPSAWGTAFTVLEIVDIDYDASHRKVKEVLSADVAARTAVQYSYDDAGRLECTAVRMNPAQFGSLPASACAHGAGGTFGPDRITRTLYDAAGQVTTVKRALGVTGLEQDYATYTYTPNGQEESVTDANGNTTSYAYDRFDRLARTTFPDTPTTQDDYEELTLDDAGNVTNRRLRDGSAIPMTYDALNRITFKSLAGAEPDVTYAYDNLSRMVSASQTGFALTYAYDALGRMTGETSPLGTVSHEYDLAGRRTKLTYPGTGLYVNHDHLDTGEVTAIRENGATTGVGVLATFAYDDLGRRTNMTRGNGALTNYAYDPVGRLRRLAHNPPGTVGDVIWTYAFNPASQITTRTQSNDLYAFALSSRSVADTHNDLNQIVTTGSANVTHDGRGNTSAIGTDSYGYSLENLMTSALGYTLLYDPQMRLRMRAGPGPDVQFGYDGQAMIAEYNSSGTLLRRYVHGPGVDEPLVWYEGTGTTDRRWLHADERGSIVAISDGTGAITTINTYDEYGIPAAGNVGRYGYTGQTWIAEVGLWYYKARFYNADGGRFMQTDRIGYADGINWYIYAANDPVNLVDPTGKDAIVLIKENGDVDITLPITFSGDAATPENINAIIQSIQSTFSGNFDGTHVTTTVVQGEYQGVSNSMVITSGPTQGGRNNGHSYVKGGHEAHVTIIDQNSGSIRLPNGTATFSTKGRNTAAHEAGHLMGLPDSDEAGNGIMDDGPGNVVSGADLGVIQRRNHVGGAINTIIDCRIEDCR